MSGAALAEAPPRLYRRWLREILGGEIPRESRATCASCAMAPPDASCARPDERYFDPRVKCCTYAPSLPNFLVGAILAEGGAGAAILADRIDSGVGVTPLGVASAPATAVLYAAAPEAFGRSRALACPFLTGDSGLCAIHDHRNAVCATFFCKHVRGRVGRDFWRGATQPLLQAIELDLSRWCVAQLVDDPDALAEAMDRPAWNGRAEPLTAETLDGRRDETGRRRLWGQWAGRERDFYLACAERVEPLAFAEVVAICGANVAAWTRRARAAYAALLAQDVPARLSPGAYRVLESGAETTRVATYSAYDPVDVPSLVLALLHLFEGRDLEAASAEFARLCGFALDASLARKLADFDILVAPAK